MEKSFGIGSTASSLILYDFMIYMSDRNREVKMTYSRSGVKCVVVDDEKAFMLGERFLS